MKKNYHDDSWLNENVWANYPEGDEVGVIQDLTQADVLAAISLIKKGKVYDLETERFKGMPVWPDSRVLTHCLTTTSSQQKTVKHVQSGKALNSRKEMPFWFVLGTIGQPMHVVTQVSESVQHVIW